MACFELRRFCGQGTHANTAGDVVDDEITMAGGLKPGIDLVVAR